MRISANEWSIGLARQQGNPYQKRVKWKKMCIGGIKMSFLFYETFSLVASRSTRHPYWRTRIREARATWQSYQTVRICCTQFPDRCIAFLWLRHMRTLHCLMSSAPNTQSLTKQHIVECAWRRPVPIALSGWQTHSASGVGPTTFLHLT